MKCGLSPKLTALVLLVLQTSASVLLMRKCQEGSKFLVISVVVTTEFVKILVSIACMLPSLSFSDIVTESIGDRRDFVTMAVPGLLYTVQNSLLYIALTNLSGAVYQITYQLKILTTGALSVLILGKILKRQQWAGLLLLTIGVGLIQLQQDKAAPSEGNAVYGTVAVLLACFTSASAGIFVEKMIKGSTKNVMTRTIQMALWSIAMGGFAALLNDWNVIVEKGFFLRLQRISLGSHLATSMRWNTDWLRHEIRRQYPQMLRQRRVYHSDHVS